MTLRRALQPLSVFILASLLSVSLHAASRAADARAEKAVTAAIEKQFLKDQFPQAEKALLDVIRRCGTQCSTQVIAKAWMYVGLTRGVGLTNLEGASEAFSAAAAQDPEVQLDATLATAEVMQSFSDAIMELTGSPPPQAAEWGLEPPSPPLACAVLPEKLQTRRVIPISCTGPNDASAVTVKYRSAKGNWTKAALAKTEDGSWQGTIPCARTVATGSLSWYVQASDVDNNVSEEFGNAGTPLEVLLVDEAVGNPPALPGQKAPARCAKVVENAGQWGASCVRDQQCNAGLTCINGSCEPPTRCERDSDCSAGFCESGTCERLAPGEFRPRLNWLSITGSLDFVSAGGDNVCVAGAEANFDCSLNGALYTAVPVQVEQAGGGVSSGTVPGTAHVLLGYERIVPLAGQNFGLEGNGGLILGATTGGNVGFSPIHLQAGIKYYIAGNVFRTSAFRPFIGVAGGIGGASRDVQVITLDCSRFSPDRQLDIPREITDAPDFDRDAFIAATQLDCRTNPASLNPPERLFPTASERFGPVFVSGSIGALLAITDGSGPIAKIEGAWFLSGEGFALRPTIGYAIGF